jgi:hypothetical protein
MQLLKVAPYNKIIINELKIMCVDKMKRRRGEMGEILHWPRV